ncbi:MAG: hypothetical protein IKP58_07515 [Victivallales bacterium]|nr:hypothetical protein [Victivallales bacterium]
MQTAETNGGWKKYEGNPVLGSAEIGTCFDVNVMKIDGVFRMYFSWRPKGALAVCRSEDGIHWDEPTIILERDEISGWEDDVNRNCVVRVGDVYHLWYTGQARGYSKIGYATSKDGYHFERQSRMPVMIPEYPWENKSVMNPYVLFDESRKVFRMWYAAGETYEPNAIGYAESTDGMTWRKSPLNPIFVQGHEFYDKDRIGGCEMKRLSDGRFAMFYIGYEDIDTARICVAVSDDGIVGWRRMASNPIVSPGMGKWDGDACYKPSVYRDDENKRWLLWYNGRLKNNEYIGLVIHQGLELE